MQLIDGKYHPLHLLGKGTYGVVYLAREVDTSRFVAIKMLKDFSRDALTRFQREAFLMSQNINNVHVVEILNYNLTGHKPYIALEYCEHGSLRSWVGQNCPWQNIAAALMHAINGLHGIHAAGGFHRDIKPDNLLVAQHPGDPNAALIKLADFGLARVPHMMDIPMTYNLGGTAGYIAPEVIAGQPFKSSADIYSLGICAVELLTGSREARALERAAVPDQFRKLITLMLAQSPAQRPNTQQIASALEYLLQPLTANAQTPAAQQEPPEEGIGGIILGGLLVVGVFAAIAALAVGAGHEWDKRVQRPGDA